MAINDNELPEYVWVPSVYRGVLLDETTSDVTQNFTDQVRDMLQGPLQPRLDLLTMGEVLNLGSVAANAVNDAIESKLPQTINDELDVITTGLRMAVRSHKSKPFLTMQVANAVLPAERQPLLDAVYESSGKLPPFFKDFLWEIQWGQIKQGIDVSTLPDKLECFRPGTIKLKPVDFTKQKQ